MSDSQVTRTAASVTTLSSTLDKLRDLACENKWKAFYITLPDKSKHLIDKTRLNRARRELDARIRREAKSSGRRKVPTTEERTPIIEGVVSHVDKCLESGPVTVSKKLRESINNEVRAHVVKLPGRRLKKTLFRPRLLYVIDDHLKNFLESIKLSLLSTNFTGKDASLRKELSVFETALIDRMADSRINASTVLNALIVHYTKVRGLRKKQDSEGLIKLDDSLKDLVASPMDSMYKGVSYADKYKATDPEKEKRDKEGNVTETTQSLAGFREANPSKSVRDYLIKHPTGSGAPPAGHITAKSVMAIVSGHIIPKTSLPEGEADRFSMDMKDGVYVTPDMCTLLAVQAMISSTLPETATVDERTQSPSRRASSVSRSRGRTPSRSPVARHKD